MGPGQRGMSPLSSQPAARVFGAFVSGRTPPSPPHDPPSPHPHTHGGGTIQRRVGGHCPAGCEQYGGSHHDGNMGAPQTVQGQGARVCVVVAKPQGGAVYGRPRQADVPVGTTSRTQGTTQTVSHAIWEEMELPKATGPFGRAMQEFKKLGWRTAWG